MTLMCIRDEAEVEGGVAFSKQTTFATVRNIYARM